MPTRSESGSRARSLLRAVSALLTMASLTFAANHAAGQLSLNPADAETVLLKRQTAARMLTRIPTIELKDQRLGDIVRFIEELTQADLEPRWINDRLADGLDPATTVTLTARNTTALELLERVLDRADRSAGRSDAEASTWQFTRYGALEFGPRSLLNRRQRLEIHDVQDLLYVVSDYDEVPDFDLNSVVSQAGQGGGGGGQSPFQSNDQDPERPSPEDLVDELTDIIRRFVEPDQWEANGGEGGSIEHYRGSLLVRGADYVHRQLNGYEWWPGGAVRVAQDGGASRTTLGTRGVDLDAMRGLPASPARP